MLFNSIDFAFFLPVVFLIYWWLSKAPLIVQNTWVVLASYVFYGWWDWRFLSLLFISSASDYLIALLMSKESDQRKRTLLLWGSLILNLGVLGFFKYYNFFVDQFVTAFTFFGSPVDPGRLDIILPVGISFYTFQTLSYTIDVYHRQLRASKSFVSFLAFVSFFPQLVAGPIERATNLLPQFDRPRRFDYAIAADGCRQILWGLVKKVVIADNAASYVNMIFENAEAYSGSTLFLGAFLFAFQIYGDFSGYSDIAIGTARLFGFDLMQNFAFPYFSRDIAEFWRRWHISLSTWFRDYVYIPLGGSRVNFVKKIRNTFVIFVLSGFWHGANWTFIVWGLLHVCYFLPLLILERNRKNLDVASSSRSLPSIKDALSILLTFNLVLIAWIFFRSSTIEESIFILNRIFSPSLFSIPDVKPVNVLVIIAVFIAIEWIGRSNKYAIEWLGEQSRLIRWVAYYVLTFIILAIGGTQQDFIYFQF